MIEKLQSAGLTLTEARIYLFLLEVQQAKAREICKQLNLHSSHIYDLLDKLLNKGLISYKLVNNTKIFYPANPEILLSKFKEKEEKLQEEKQDLDNFIRELHKLQLKKSNNDYFKYFEGTQGVRSMFLEFINSWEQNTTVHVFSAPIAYNRWNAFLLEYFHPIRTEKKIQLKLIIPKSMKKHGSEREQFPLTDIKYTDEEYPAEFAVCGEYVYILSENEKPYAMLYKDKNFAETQKMVFNQLWENTK
ncbi:MAG: hypothetical protein H6502_02730 [Candidatus Woesearchaeota archaeon]|nr:MAG: hypothetical protein H6502_02730 [Candidatus Woesearchaeota archaeon]